MKLPGSDCTGTHKELKHLCVWMIRQPPNCGIKGWRNQGTDRHEFRKGMDQQTVRARRAGRGELAFVDAPRDGYASGV